MKHDIIPQPFPDEFGIGQRKVAQIRAETAMTAMGRAVRDAFSTGHVSDEWRAMQRRLFYRYRAQYERAKGILEVMQ